MSTVTPYLNLVKPAPLENFSRATYNTNLDLIDAGLIADSKRAEGLKLYQEAIGNSGPHTDGIVNNIASYTFKAGRKYRIVWDATIAITDTTTFFYMSINTAATTDAAGLITGLTGLNGRTIQRQSGSGTYSGEIVAYFNPVSDTTVQIKFRAARTGGAGTATVVANAGEKTIYNIYDDGAQF